MGRKISGTKLKFLQGWIPDNQYRSSSKLYHFDSTAGQLTVKRHGFYWLHGQVSDIIQS